MTENVKANEETFENPWERLSDQENSDDGDDECTCVLYQNQPPFSNNVGTMLQKERDQANVDYTRIDGDGNVKNDTWPTPDTAPNDGAAKSTFVDFEVKTTDVPSVNTLTNCEETYQSNSNDVPDTHVVLAWLITVCFNIPLGVLAVCLSMKATKLYLAGNKKQGRRFTLLSLFASLAGIVLTVVTVMGVVLFLAVTEAGRKLRGRG